MHPKLKNILNILRDEKTDFRVLQKEITPHLTQMQHNDVDQICISVVFKKLQDEWDQKKCRFN